MLSKFAHAETVIQNKILLDPDLTDTEVRLYLVIKMLSYKDGYCWATNTQLGELVNKTDNAINLCLRRLKKKEYIVINTDFSRSPKRKIFTMQAWSELVYTKKVPVDCTSSIPAEFNTYTKEMSFKEFKNFVSKHYAGAVFNLAPGNKLNYRPDIYFKITKSGYIENTWTGDLITKEDALKIWEYLYVIRSTVLDLFREKGY